MKIKCVSNQATDLPDFLREKGKMCEGVRSFALKIGKEYTVYGMTVIDGVVWYYICEEDFTYYPSLVPCPLFEVTDNKLSRFWIFSFIPRRNDNCIWYSCRWVFPEWGQDPHFHSYLIDAYDDPLALFKQYKIKMDLEFPDPDVTEKAEIGDRDWLICPKCIDAWFWPSDRDALVVCPKCETIYNNPRYCDNRS